MIEVRCLGHSGLDLNFDGTRIICDPWLSPRGSHLGNWNQFPDNAQIAPESLHDARYLYLSHLHQDHFDVDTLRPYPKTVRVLIPAFPGGVMRKRLAELGFTDVVECAEWEPLDLGGGTMARIVMDPTRYILDSCLVVEHRGQVIVNQNDCFLDTAQLQRLAAFSPLVHFNQFSGASYYPAIYEFAPDDMLTHVDRYRELLFTRYCEVSQKVGARYLVPSAGPPCFLDDKNYHLNFGGSIFYDTDELLARLDVSAPEVRQRVRPMYPEDRAVIREDGSAHFDEKRPYSDRRAYLDAYRQRREPVILDYRNEWRARARPVSFRDMREYFYDFFKYEDLTRDLDLLIKVELSDGPSLFVDFRKRPVRYPAESPDQPNYTLRLESAWMSHVLQGNLNWYDLLMSHQVSLRRSPDRYSVGLINHLYYRDVPELLDLVRRQNLGGQFIHVRDDEMEYECQKWCPHVGRDLAEGTVKDGILTCPGHGWQFDLRNNGKCISGGGQSVIVRSSRLIKENS